MLSMIQDILLAEAEAVRAIPADNPFVACVSLFLEAKHRGGKVVVAGVGKAGEVGRKMASTFCSVGVPSVFLHPLEAQHGDLGVLHAQDVLLLISNSGKTREIIELEMLSKRLHPGLKTIALTGNRDCELARASTHVLWNGAPREVCPLGLTPTTSTTTMAVIGDVLAVLVVRISNYTPAEYAQRHHSGYLGEKSKQAAAAFATGGASKDELKAIYRVLHQENADYRDHNWLLADLPLLLRHEQGAMLELGAGNLHCARAASSSLRAVTAIDWVESPVARAGALPANLDYRIADATAITLPRVGLVASSDFLEHLSPHEIAPLIAAMAAAGARQFHTIACYPDSRGLHLTMRPPEFWLQAFTACDPAFALARTVSRRGRADQPVITITRGIAL